MSARLRQVWAEIGLWCATGIAVSGCGATGLDWVDQPQAASEWPRSAPGAAGRGAFASSSPTTIPALPDERVASPAAHPRLDHVVTLGAVASSGFEAQGPADPGPAVSVTINNYGQAVPTGAAYYGSSAYYGSFGTGRGAGAARTFGVTGGTHGTVSSMQPGQNWPTILDHGPAFPYRSAPASPSRGTNRGQ